MKKIVFPLLIPAFALLAHCAVATPRAFDVNRDKPAVSSGEGIIIGKVESLGYDGRKPVLWWPWWKQLTGVAVSMSISLNGVESFYAITREGYFALRVPAGTISDLRFKFLEAGSTAGAGSAGDENVSIGVDSTFKQEIKIPLAAQPISVSAGKLTVLPIRSVTFLLKGGFKEPVVDSGARNGEVIAWFRKTYPGLAARFKP